MIPSHSLATLAALMALGAIASPLTACGASTTTTTSAVAPPRANETTHAAPPSSCAIGGTPFTPVFAKREDDDDDNAVRVYVFAAAPSTPDEKKSACERATPIPAFAGKADKRAIEVDFNDAKNLATDFDVTFLTRSEGDSYMHDAAKSPVVTLSGTATAQTLHIKAKSDDADCELTVPVLACPK